MFGSRTLSRSLLAAPFIVGGIAALRSKAQIAPVAEPVGAPIAGAVGLPKDPEQMVTINAGVQIGAGVLLALGVLPRVASLALAASLVPTTLAGHRFWELDGDERSTQLMHFAKNAGMLGGLLANSLDTGGRPSVFWAGRKAARDAAGSISSAASSVADSFDHALPDNLPIVNN